MDLKARTVPQRWSRFFLLCIVLPCVTLAGCTRGVRRDSALPWMPEYNVHRHVLKNGLTVLFVEDHSVPVVSYATWFKTGSAWEKPGQTGIAHLFEHMMFKGTPRFSAHQFHQNLESKGAVVNAFTQQDATVYYEVIASRHLELVIDMESDRLKNLVITQEALDSEREVVKEERRLRLESNFSALQHEKLKSTALAGHPYGWPIIGSQEDLDSLTVEQCRAFFETYYQPANALIVIAGDFDYEKTKGWIEKYYGDIKGRPVPELELSEPKRPEKEVFVEMRNLVKAESLQVGYFIPSMHHEDAEAISMLSWTLFGMASSRANLRLVREKQIVLDVGAEASLKRFPYLFLLWADMKSGISAKRALAEIDAIIEEIKRTPPDPEELVRVKNAILYATINEAKSPAGLASWLASGEFYHGDYRHVYRMLKRFQAMTPEDLQRMARKYLNKNNRVVVVLKPEAAGI